MWNSIYTFKQLQISIKSRRNHLTFSMTRKEMFYLMMHSTYFNYMASDLWRRPTHMGYSFQLAARVLVYAPSYRQESTYHSLCYTSNGTLAGTRIARCVHH